MHQVSATVVPAGIVDEVESIGGANEVLIVNLSDVLPRLAEGYRNNERFRIDGAEVKIATVRNAILAGKAPYTRDSKWAKRVGNTVVSPIVQSWGRAGSGVAGGDGGLRDFKRLDPADRRLYDKAVADATMERERLRKAGPVEVAGDGEDRVAGNVEAPRCLGTTKAGERCKREARGGDFCEKHGDGTPGAE